MAHAIDERTSTLSLLVCACLLVPLACTSNTVMLLDDDSGSSSGADDSTTSTSLPDPSSTTLPDPTSPSTTLPDPADDTTTADPSTSGSQFIVSPDGGDSFECDMFAQDCPPGDKCMPWANDGGNAWNATRCSPIADDPGGPDDPCMVEGSATSGIDDCELGAMCWDVDPETNEGYCMPFCVGSESSPYCEDPSRFCFISGDAALILCVPQCQPIEQDCPEGQGCYPLGSAWTCVPDGEVGAYGDPCEYVNVCDPGLVCVDAAAVPPGQPCEGAPGCCTEICDLSDPLGDQQCTGAAEGQICTPWYENGAAPVGYDNVGACSLP